MQPDWASGVLWYAVFLFSTIFHEAAHAWTALKLGDDTAARGGQISLNPWPHIRREPFGMVIMPLISWFAGGWLIGWASAPFNPDWARQHPRHAALMSLAGPGANLLLLIAAGWLIRVGVEWNWFMAPSSINASRLVTAITAGFPALAALGLSVVFSLNLLLFVFNLLPLPPLDGSNLPLLFLSTETATRYSEALRQPWLRLIGILVASRLLSPYFPVLLRSAANFLHPHAHYH